MSTSTHQEAVGIRTEITPGFLEKRRILLQSIIPALCSIVVAYDFYQDGLDAIPSIQLHRLGNPEGPGWSELAIVVGLLGWFGVSRLIDKRGGHYHTTIETIRTTSTSVTDTEVPGQPVWVPNDKK
jgi:hypothetical protein